MVRFKEKRFNTTDRDVYSVIYFLLDSSMNVIYIGKTKGFPACLNNHIEKEFETVKYIVVYEDEAAEMLGEYILKYKPKYNSNVDGFLSVERARDVIREYVGNSKCSVGIVKKMLVQHNIPFVRNMNGNIQISPSSVRQLCGIYLERCGKQ